jgi:molybdenum cofactor synthesis domain-containing protein
MVSLDEARRVVLDGCRPLSPVRWPLGVADRCVTAESVSSPGAVPPFDNSAMDGYAVRADDVRSAGPDAPVSLVVVATVLAGHPCDLAIGPGQCARIMTGAPMPAGVDAVVPVEQTTTGSWDPASSGGDDGIVGVFQAVDVGAHVRRAGEDVQRWDEVVGRSVVLNPARLGVLAGAGRATVLVHPRPRVGVFTTGDELVAAPWPLAPGQIRDTNRTVLLALLAREGFDPVDLGRIPDDRGALTAAVNSGVRSCDALVTTGGVSMGQVDLVRVVLDELGDMTWMQVAIKPAKPFAFGVVRRGRGGRPVPVFGLPGNPVSSAISFELLARPGLRRLAGFADHELVRPPVRARVLGALARRPDGKVHYARVMLSADPESGWVVRSAGGQGSHQLSALAAANALAVLPDGDGADDGELVEVIPFDATILS